jgi:ABC-type sugar transport system substrate-binding protein
MSGCVTKLVLFVFIGLTAGSSAKTLGVFDAPDDSRCRLVYIASDLGIPFWDIMRRGMVQETEDKNCRIEVCNSENSAEQELRHVVKAIRSDVDGIIISPTSSSACSTVLELAERANVPVVIADVGTDEGDYVSSVASDNFAGAHQLGQKLAAKMLAKGWQDGTVGIVAIPQDRINGRMRTAGFMNALEVADIKGCGIEQQVTFSAEETYTACLRLIEQCPALRALWLQGSNQYQAALRAIEEAGKVGEIVLLTFDAEPEFNDLIRDGVLLGAAMQQPYLMGQVAARNMLDHLAGKPVAREVMLPTLTITKDNLEANLAVIRRNVLGLDAKSLVEP